MSDRRREASDHLTNWMVGYLATGLGGVLRASWFAGMSSFGRFILFSGFTLVSFRFI